MLHFEQKNLVFPFQPGFLHLENDLLSLISGRCPMLSKRISVGGRISIGALLEILEDGTRLSVVRWLLFLVAGLSIFVITIKKYYSKLFTILKVEIVWFNIKLIDPYCFTVPEIPKIFIYTKAT